MLIREINQPYDSVHISQSLLSMYATVFILAADSYQLSQVFKSTFTWTLEITAPTLDSKPWHLSRQTSAFHITKLPSLTYTWNFNCVCAVANAGLLYALLPMPGYCMCCCQWRTILCAVSLELVLWGVSAKHSTNLPAIAASLEVLQWAGTRWPMSIFKIAANFCPNRLLVCHLVELVFWGVSEKRRTNLLQSEALEWAGTQSSAIFLPELFDGLASPKIIIQFAVSQYGTI